MNVDEFEELKDKLDEQMADVQERQDFFINAGQVEDNDELLDELDALEAEMAQDELDKIDIGSGAVMDAVGKGEQQQQKVKPVANKQDDDELLAQMMA